MQIVGKRCAANKCRYGGVFARRQNVVIEDNKLWHLGEEPSATTSRVSWVPPSDERERKIPSSARRGIPQAGINAS